MIEKWKMNKLKLIVELNKSNDICSKDDKVTNINQRRSESIENWSYK